VDDGGVSGVKALLSGILSVGEVPGNSQSNPENTGFIQPHQLFEVRDATA
jgi:hypothetical protein